VMVGGIKWLVLVTGVFALVTMHELCHSLVAMYFGISVREITLLPIGGVASMSAIPEKPIQEFLISLAGPAFNIAVIIVFYFPLKYVLGPDVLFHPLSASTWPLTAAYLYWINLILAGFNLIPAFPMDGGRILRAILSGKLGPQKATKIAAMFGHLFALVFAYFGILKFNIILIAIAIFIYMAASSEETQVNIKETLKKFRVRDILAGDFLSLRSDATLAKVLEIVFHSHQEDFPVVDDGSLTGFITRQDIITNIHQFGLGRKVFDCMRSDFPKVKETDLLFKVQNIMQLSAMNALPVLRNGDVVGVITLEDIGRVYAIASNNISGH